MDEPGIKGLPPGPKGLQETLPPLSANEAMVEANRCLFCYDAPCTHACPTHIDVPGFIKKISTDNLTGAARTIFQSNLLAATCARVCPVEELCEGACVLGKEHKPIRIGRLQRYAMDHVYRGGTAAIKAVVKKSSTATGSKIAIVGSGPAGLSCAGELARRGHSVTVFEKRPLAGGLSTYGIISLREPIEASLEEVGMLEALGVRVEHGAELGVNVTLDELRECFDAVFLGIGLGATPAMGIPGEECILDGLWYIEQSKLDSAAMKIGRDVVVIGAGNTAIDCATVAKRLGAERVTMVYRRSEQEMTAYPHERDFIRREGVDIRFLTQPVRVIAESGRVTGLACVAMKLAAPDASGRRVAEPAGEAEFVIPADQVVKAIGQEKPALAQKLGLATNRGFVQISGDFETSVPGVFAGGDSVRVKNVASTVMAVQDGKLAAMAIQKRLENKANG